MPPPPAPQTIAAAFAALLADATSWLTAAAALADAGATAGTLTLDAGRLSAAASGLTGVYAEVQRHTATLLAEAARTGTATAAALGTAADAYESDERAAVHDLRGQW